MTWWGSAILGGMTGAVIVCTAALIVHRIKTGRWTP